MKIEFNQGEFNARINSGFDESGAFALEGVRKILNENSSLILGIVSFIIALANLSFGLFMNLSTEVLSKFAENGLEHWISVLFVTTVIMFLFSVLCGVFSIVLFAISNKKTSHFAGFAISIVSFSVCAVGLVLNIMGMVAW